MEAVFDPGVHQVGKVLCFAAHPDDIDFGAAGTVARWTSAGVDVVYCILTDGDAGGFSVDGRLNIIQLRRSEQTQAAQRVGVRSIHFMGERDGFLEPNHELTKKIVAVIRRERPDVVLSLHPERNWDRIQKSHPDHLACGEAVTRAVYPAAENAHAFPELAEAGLQSHKVPWLWFYAGPSQLENHFVDVTDQVGDKLGAIQCHASQHPDVDRMDGVVRVLLRDNARRAGYPQGHSAEAFQVVGVNSGRTIAGF